VSGYHPHKRQWRKRKMTDTDIKYDPRHQMRIKNLKTIPEDFVDFIEKVSRAYKEKPDKKDLQEIRKFLKNNPELCKFVFGLAESLQGTLIKNMIQQEVPRIALEEYAMNLRKEFGYHDAPVMEQLIIENIVIAWLHVYWAEFQLVLRMGPQHTDIAISEYWERRLTLAQKRYLRACETLAKIRKMAIPAVQLNIGDKQINVAGNLPGQKS
jgi:hypothetical protein